MNAEMINREKNVPRTDYPRPQWVRKEWINLNGKWEFAFDFGNSGKAREMEKNGEYPLEILVPFCPESRLSGIEYKDFISAVWYRRTIKIEKRESSRILLHFGAVDYLCEVFVNEVSVGTHKGGYSSFTFDITDYVCDGMNSIVVNAQDDVRSGHQPAGKQCEDYKSRRAKYTRTTGIWQTVWLEYVPDKYLGHSRVTPHAADGTVDISVFGCHTEPNDRVRVTALYNGEKVGQAEAELSGGMAGAFIQVSERHLWDIEKPELYDLFYELIDGRTGKVVDTVYSYFGLRDVALGKNALKLNGRTIFMRLILDQGFNPDGIYTYPDIDWLKRDIELSMKLGFNGARLHQRVFEEQTLYWADKMGYIVWSEYANGNDLSTAQGIEDFLPEWTEVLERDFNHPSIIGWCPFNESYWGKAIDSETHRIVYRITKMLDPTRPCIDASGGMHYETDMFDAHDYEQNPSVFREYLAPMIKDKAACHLPIERYVGNKHGNSVYKGQPYWVSEYGGTFWNPDITENNEKAWGYGNAPRTEEDFIERYEELTNALLEHPRVCGFCYTQLTDIEQEQNGLYFYNRSEKHQKWVYQRILEINSKTAQIEKQQG